MRRLVQSLVAAAVLTTTAAAQPAPRWSVAAGYEVFALRDISRNIRPPDASPIAWRGAGPALIGRYDIERERAAHVIEITAARARNFAYAGPSRSTPAFSADAAGRFAAGYEYRRYPWRDVLIDGLDIGVGLQGLATRVGFDRHITATLASRTRISGGGGAGVIAARWRAHDRLRVGASWANGAVVSRRTTRHSAQPADDTLRGGNWLTYSMVRVDWRVAGSTMVTAAWRHDYDGYSSGHFAYSAYRHRIEFGGTYGR